MLNTAKVEPGSTVAVFGLGGIGLSVIQGAVMAKAGRIIAIDLNPDKFAMATALGATDTLNPAEIGGDVVRSPQGDDQRRRRLLLRVHRQRQGHAASLGVLPHGLGRLHHHRRGRSRPGNPDRPFQLVTGRTWKGTAFGGVKGRSQLPGYVENYLQGQIELDRMVTHTMPLEDINTAFDLMHEGKKHPFRHHFLGNPAGGAHQAIKEFPAVG